MFNNHKANYVTVYGLQSMEYSQKYINLSNKNTNKKRIGLQQKSKFISAYTAAYKQKQLNISDTISRLRNNI